MSISIQPGAETFGAANIPVIDDTGAHIQLQALGSYIHPQVTKDITSQVTWTSNTSSLATVDANGSLTATGEACGNAIITATVQTNKSIGGRSSSGAIVTGTMTANVVCFNPSAGGLSLSVSFLGSGSGMITSAPPGINCNSTAPPCSGDFPSGTTVTLTAAPNGTFGGWGGCDAVSGSGLACTTNDLTSDRSVTATFD